MENRAKTKGVFYTELAYAAAIVILALGAAFMERADFGMSMVVAPAYLLHLKISQYLPWYSFGVSEYVLQAVLLLALCIVIKRPSKGYFFSFVTAVLYGTVLDGCIFLVSHLPLGGMPGRVLYYLAGMLLCAVGVALFFKAYISPEAYELFVRELSRKSGRDIGTVKTGYDCCSCLLAVILSFSFFGFGRFEGVKLGTVICALINGRIIGIVSRRLDVRFDFTDALPLRGIFEK